MSKEFIESSKNSSLVSKAIEQEVQLAYFTLSEIQEGRLSDEFYRRSIEKDYQGNDYFLNFVKSIFKSQNYLLFQKYLRRPIPSSKLINNRILPQLERVFGAENADFKYSVEGVEEADYVSKLNTKEFERELFDKLLFEHNSILIVDKDEESPVRYFIDISSVVSISGNKEYISKIAFRGYVDGVRGIVYIDDDIYAFYPETDGTEMLEEPSIVATHGLGHCPAYFISPKCLNKKNWVMRESIFSYIREELEEYTFLKTIQKMTDPNGAIPIVTKLDVDIEKNTDVDGGEMGMSADDAMSSQKASEYGNIPKDGDGVLQVGTVLDVPIIEKDDGSIDMDVVKNLITFHYIPVESLRYLDRRVKDIEHSIIYTLVGGIIDGLREGSKNREQIEESLSVLENTLIRLAGALNKIRKQSDTDMLRLVYGDKVKEVFIFYGSDFFLDTQTMMYDNLEKAINPIEKKNILIRLNINRFKGNAHQQARHKILYDLIPFVSNQEFTEAQALGLVDEATAMYQLQFNYWISRFEATYGDIVIFYKELEVPKPERLMLINNLINKLIGTKIIEK